MAGETGSAVATGVALLLPAIPVLWKSSDLRGNLDEKWSERVDLARAGLSERAVVLLRRLQRETDEVLGTVDSFDPNLVQADPAPLARIAGNVQRTMRARRRAKTRLRLLLGLSYFAPVLTLAYVVGVVGATAWYAKWVKWRIMPEAGFWVTGSALAIGLCLLAAKFYLEQKLITAERMSRPLSETDQSGVDIDDDNY